jgi:hypothetical protein
MWVVLLTVYSDSLCYDFVYHILHLYYSKFPYEAWAKSHWKPNTRPYTATMQVATAYWTDCYFKLILCYVLQGKRTLMVAQ